MSLERRIKLNVGGTTYETFYSTLQHIPYFATLCDDKGPFAPTEDNTYFIDRDSTVFRDILLYARSKMLRENVDMKLLHHEAEYYGFVELQELIEDNYENYITREAYHNQQPDLMDLLLQIRDALESINEKSDAICDLLRDIDSGITSIDVCR